MKLIFFTSGLVLTGSEKRQKIFGELHPRLHRPQHVGCFMLSTAQLAVRKLQELFRRFKKKIKHMVSLET